MFSLWWHYEMALLITQTVALGRCLFTYIALFNNCNYQAKNKPNRFKQTASFGLIRG